MCLSSVFDNNITMPLYETYVHWPTNIGSLGVGTYVICLMNIGSFLETIWHTLPRLFQFHGLSPVGD